MKSEQKLFWKWWDTTYLNVSKLNYYFWTLVEALPDAQWIVSPIRDARHGRWGILNQSRCDCKSFKVDSCVLLVTSWSSFNISPVTAITLWRDCCGGGAGRVQVRDSCKAWGQGKVATVIDKDTCCPPRHCYDNALTMDVLPLTLSPRCWALLQAIISLRRGGWRIRCGVDKESRQ